MADQETTLALVAGDGTDILGYAVENGVGGPTAAEVAIRANGTFVSTAAPFPTNDASAIASLGSILADVGALLAVLSTPLVATSVVSSVINVGTVSTNLATAGSMTKGWSVQNTSPLTNTGYTDICWGSTAVAGHGFFRLFTGSSAASGGGVSPPVGTPMTGIASTTGQVVVVTVYN